MTAYVTPFGAELILIAGGATSASVFKYHDNQQLFPYGETQRDFTYGRLWADGNPLVGSGQSDSEILFLQIKPIAPYTVAP